MPTIGQPSVFTSTHAGAAGILDTARSRCLQRSQYIEDTVEPSFFLPGIISLFIMCVGIIRNNSLVGGRARAEVWTPATERVTVYCIWRPSALIIRPQGQVCAYVTKNVISHRLNGGDGVRLGREPSVRCRTGYALQTRWYIHLRTQRPEEDEYPHP